MHGETEQIDRTRAPACRNVDDEAPHPRARGRKLVAHLVPAQKKKGPKQNHAKTERGWVRKGVEIERQNE